MHKYNMDWLEKRVEKGNEVEFLFFWGHIPKSKISKSCLSQWFWADFEIYGNTFPTAEHWMMYYKAQLFDNYFLMNDILQKKHPKEAKEIGRNITNFDLLTWKKYRVQIVKLGNIHKFNQNKDLLDFLLSTGDKILVEASPFDMVWGIGLSEGDDDIHNIYAWQGENLLGFILMEVRDFFKSFGQFNRIESMVIPPWIKFPEYDSADLFWRMGTGEEYIEHFYGYLGGLSKREQAIYALNNPEPFSWQGANPLSLKSLHDIL